MAIGGLRRVPASRRESKPGVESTRPSSGGQFYGWWLAGIAALVMIIGTVPLIQGEPLQTDLNIQTTPFESLTRAQMFFSCWSG